VDCALPCGRGLLRPDLGGCQGQGRDGCPDQDMSGFNKGMAAVVGKNVSAQHDLVTELGRERQAFAPSAPREIATTSRLLFGGRRSMDQHLADLQKENQLTTLLNRSRQRGFITTQQDFAFRLRAYQQMLL
jgi:hypothetical protein